MLSYVEERVAVEGYSTVSDYIQQLIHQEQKRKAREHLESMLLEGLESGSETLMTDGDWQEIRQAVRENVARREQLSQSGRPCFS